MRDEDKDIDKQDQVELDPEEGDQPNEQNGFSRGWRQWAFFLQHINRMPGGQEQSEGLEKHSDLADQITLRGLPLGEIAMKYLRKIEFTNLSTLALEDCSLTPQLIHMIRDVHFENLTEINFSGNKQLGSEGMIEIARGKWWNILQILNLNNCCIGDEGLEALAETQAENLKSLDLSQNQISDAGVRFLTQKSWNLSKLLLFGQEMRLSDISVRYICGQPWPELEELSLQCFNWRRGIQELSNGHFPNIKSLSITCEEDSEGGIDNCIALELMRSSWLNQLELLYLSLTRMTESMQENLCEMFSDVGFELE